MSWIPGLQWNHNANQGGNPSGTQPSTPNTPHGSPSAGAQNNNGQPANSQVAQQNNGQQGQQQQQQQQQTNPLDQFTSFFQSQQNNGGQDSTQNGGQPAKPNYDGFIAPWDTNTVSQRAQQLDFTRGMNPEIIQKALGGDPQAFMEAMNHVARQAFIGSTQAAHGFADRATKTGLERFSGSLDDRFREYGVRNQTVGTNPIYDHPAVKPMVDALKFQIASSDPKLSPEQVAKKVDEYFNTMGNSFTTQSQQSQSATTQSKEPDWLAQFNLAAPDGR